MTFCVLSSAASDTLESSISLSYIQSKPAFPDTARWLLLDSSTCNKNMSGISGIMIHISKHRSSMFYNVVYYKNSVGEKVVRNGGFNATPVIEAARRQLRKSEALQAMRHLRQRLLPYFIHQLSDASQ